MYCPGTGLFIIQPLGINKSNGKIKLNEKERKKSIMKKKALSLLMAAAMIGGCISPAAVQAEEEPVEIQVFIAASLNTVMQEVAAA